MKAVHFYHSIKRRINGEIRMKLVMSGVAKGRARQSNTKLESEEVSPIKMSRHGR